MTDAQNSPTNSTGRGGWPNRQEVLERALEEWGEKAQFLMAHEECGELITAVARYYRGRASKEEVLEEVADVQLLLDQLAIILGNGEAIELERQKFVRFRDRLDSYQEVSKA